MKLVSFCPHCTLHGTRQHCFCCALRGTRRHCFCCALRGTRRHCFCCALRGTRRHCFCCALRGTGQHFTPLRWTFPAHRCRDHAGSSLAKSLFTVLIFVLHSLANCAVASLICHLLTRPSMVYSVQVDTHLVLSFPTYASLLFCSPLCCGCTSVFRVNNRKTSSSRTSGSHHWR